MINSILSLSSYPSKTQQLVDLFLENFILSVPFWRYWRVRRGTCDFFLKVAVELFIHTQFLSWGFIERLANVGDSMDVVKLRGHQ
jgi:hypothetical protein